MAKVAFSKLKCKIEDSIITIKFREEEIEIKQYLPIQEKLKLIGEVISFAHEEAENYSNPVKLKVYTDLQILFNYTNISFTEKQKEDIPKLYDLVYSSGLLEEVLSNIPADESETIYEGVLDSTSAIYEYKNSALGIIDTLTDNFKGMENTNVDIEKLRNDLMELANSSIIKDIAPALGLITTVDN